MPRAVVVFDTNLYRALSDDRLARLRTAERRLSIVASPSLLVVGELLVHTRDPEGAAYRASVAALRRVWEHCRIERDSRSFMQFLGPPEVIVAESLWGKRKGRVSKIQEGLARVFGEVVCELGSAGDPEDPVKTARLIAPIAAFMQRSEDAFVWAVQNVALQLIAALKIDGSTKLDPSKRAELDALRRNGGGRVHAAGAYVRRVADLFGEPLTEEQVGQHARTIARTAAVAFELFDALVAKAIYSGMKVERRANSVWDFYFSLFASTGMSVSGTPVRAISDDEEIHTAATAVGRTNVVWRLSEYEAHLEDGSV